jgi:hypothetical protein
LSLKDINGKTVEINSFNIKLHRFIPFNRCLNEFGEASVEIEIWKNGTKVKTIQNGLPRGCGKETQDNVITYEGDKFDNVNSMKIFVSCKIPTTARYGASYCSAQLAIDSFIVTVKEEATGFFIGSDGFRYISPEGGYGLQVNSNGVKFLSYTTWVTLEQYIKTITGK